MIIPITRKKPWPEDHSGVEYYSHYRWQLVLGGLDVLIEQAVFPRDCKKWQPAGDYYGVWWDMENIQFFQHDKIYYDGEHHTYRIGPICFGWFG